jgi:hypothetical protein
MWSLDRRQNSIQSAIQLLILAGEMVARCRCTPLTLVAELELFKFMPLSSLRSACLPFGAVGTGESESLRDVLADFVGSDLTVVGLTVFDLNVVGLMVADLVATGLTVAGLTVAGLIVTGLLVTAGLIEAGSTVTGLTAIALATIGLGARTEFPFLLADEADFSSASF